MTDEEIQARKEKFDSSLYAMQRIDLLLISISGAGLYAIWDIFKFLKTPTANTVDPLLITWSALLFVLTILVNFFAQLLSFYSNFYEWPSDWGKITNAMNWASAIFMLVGVALLAIFCLIYLNL